MNMICLGMSKGDNMNEQSEVPTYTLNDLDGHCSTTGDLETIVEFISESILPLVGFNTDTHEYLLDAVEELNEGDITRATQTLRYINIELELNEES